jgi:hypothetical protein
MAREVLAGAGKFLAVIKTLPKNYQVSLNVGCLINASKTPRPTAADILGKR